MGELRKLLFAKVRRSTVQNNLTEAGIDPNRIDRAVPGISSLSGMPKRCGHATFSQPKSGRRLGDLTVMFWYSFTQKHGEFECPQARFIPIESGLLNKRGSS